MSPAISAVVVDGAVGVVWGAVVGTLHKLVVQHSGPCTILKLCMKGKPPRFEAAAHAFGLTQPIAGNLFVPSVTVDIKSML